MRPALLLLTLLLVSPALSAALLDPDAMGIVLGTVIVVVTAMLALTLMFSRSFNSPQLEAWTKNELRELVVAAILLVAVNIIFFGTGNLVGILTGEADHQDVARNFIADTQGTIEEAYRDSMRLFHYLTMRAGFWVYSSTAEFWVMYATFTGGQYSGASVFFGPLQMATQGLTTAWFEYAALGILLDFITTASAVLLPVAFIFRFVPFTRRMGNMLIALAIGGAVIFPFSIVLVSQLHDLLGSGMPDPDVNENAFNSLDISDVVAPVEAVCSIQAIRLLLNLNEVLFSAIACLPVAWFPPAYVACAGSPVGNQSGIMPIVYNILQIIFRTGYAMFFAAEGLLGFIRSNEALGLSGADLTDIVYGFLLEVNNFVVLAYMDALVIVIVTYAGIKSVSAALGGEYMMPAISRLVR